MLLSAHLSNYVKFLWSPNLFALQAFSSSPPLEDSRTRTIGTKDADTAAWILLRPGAGEKEIGQAIATARITAGPFESKYDLQRRVSSTRKTELALLANAGHSIGQSKSITTEPTGHIEVPLFENIPDVHQAKTLAPNDNGGEIGRGLQGYRVTMGPQPITYHRAEMNREGVFVPLI